MKPIRISALPRLMECAGSLHLPWAETTGDAAAFGTEVHSHLVDVAQAEGAPAIPPDGVRAPHDTPPALRPFLESIDRAVPFLGGGYSPEVEVTWDGWLTGHIDWLGIAPDQVVVIDVKTGRKHPRARDSWQLRGYALAAATMHGKCAATVAHYALNRDGSWFPDVAEFDAFDLASFAAELRALKAREDARTGIPDVKTGDHCQYCPSLGHCPAYTALAVRLGKGEELGLLATLAANLDDDILAAEVYSRVSEIERVVKHIKSGLVARAFRRPIPLPNGKTYEIVEEKRTNVLGAVARQVLAEKYGQGVAESACEFDASRASIERALRPVAKERGEPLAKLVREAMAAIEEAGGVEVKTASRPRERAA